MNSKVFVLNLHLWSTESWLEAPLPPLWWLPSTLHPHGDSASQLPTVMTQSEPGPGHGTVVTVSTQRAAHSKRRQCLCSLGATGGDCDDWCLINPVWARGEEVWGREMWCWTPRPLREKGQWPILCPPSGNDSEVISLESGDGDCLCQVVEETHKCADMVDLCMAGGMWVTP